MTFLIHAIYQPHVKIRLALALKLGLMRFTITTVGSCFHLISHILFLLFTNDSDNHHPL